MPAPRPQRAPRKTGVSKPRRIASVVPAFHIPPILLEGDPLPEPITPSLEAATEMPAERPIAAEKTAAEVLSEAPAVVVESKTEDRPESPALVEIPPVTALGLESVAPRAAMVELPAVAVSVAELSAHQDPALKPHEISPPAELPQPKASIWLSPRDPHSLLLSWEWQAPPTSGHPAIFLRLFEGQITVGEPVMTRELPVAVSHQFLPVGKANTWFTAQIGFFHPSGQWMNLAEATPVQTLADQITSMAEVMVTQKVNDSAPASLPTTPAVPLRLAPEIIQAPSTLPGPGHNWVSDAQAAATADSVQSGEQLASPVPPPRFVGEPSSEPAKTWGPPIEAPPEQSFSEKATAAGRAAIAAHIEPAAGPVPAPPVAFPLQTGASERWISSLEWAKQPAPQPAGEQPVPPSPSAPSSLPGPADFAPAKGKDYWLVAEVELIVYGATEPGSRVTLAGAEVALRPDGSFSCRLALPAGRHEIPVRAVAPDGDASRQVSFLISRA